jgi:uncharacterized cupredoxin-like copper-binding protein/TusA-related sulfurtransferase
MKTDQTTVHTVDVRGLFGPDALLTVEAAAAGKPGEVIEVISDERGFAADLVRWCSEGYGRLLEARYDRQADRFRIALPTRREGSHQRSHRRAWPLLTVAAIALGACGSTTTTASTTPSPAATVAPVVSAPLQVTLAEWKVDVPTTIKAGRVTFTIKNAGTIEHELLVFSSALDPANYPMAGGDIQEDGAGITLASDGPNIAVDGSQDRTVDLTKPGKYLFVCNIPTHFGQGMSKLVTVVS